MGLFGGSREDEIARKHPMPARPQAKDSASLPENASSLNPESVLALLRRDQLDAGGCPFRAVLSEPGRRLVLRRMLRMPTQAVLEEEKAPAPFSRERTLCGGLHALGFEVLTIFEQRQGQVQVVQGALVPDKMAPEADSALSSVVLGAYPGARMEDFALDAGVPSPCCAVLTGMPDPCENRGRRSIPHLESLFSALGGEEFGLAFRASPISLSAVRARALELTDMIHRLSGGLRESRDISRQSATVVRAERMEITNRTVQQAMDMAEAALAEQTRGIAEGMWRWQLLAWSGNPGVLRRVTAHLSALYSGPSSLPEPVRVLPVDPAASGHPALWDVQDLSGSPVAAAVSNSRLASVLRFPGRSFPGFRADRPVVFSTAQPVAPRPPLVRVGAVLDQGRETGAFLDFPTEALCAHGLVGGMTGAGKTNTCMALLEGLDRAGIPFLVIEPAKAEYRGLMVTQRFQGRFRVFTLGDETVSPFRLNPFEFPEGCNVNTHLDLLKTVISSAFAMYGPMPHILEEAIVRVYRRRGWDLVSGRNSAADRLGREDIFPTLRDLREEIDPVVQSLGYGRELSMDMRGALHTRIKSLLTGAKGIMLGARQSTPMGEVLAGPTVLELARMGDDQEKALIMGLLLVAIHEYREHVTAGSQRGLMHVTLIEEAHRVLKNIPSGTNPEVANVAGKAVEMFNNILAEVRAFGEGLLIAEQIPSKLSPDAVKNTGIKLAMRLHSPDDCGLMGDSMALTEEQKRHLASLPSLEAVAFGGGLEEAVWVRIPPCKPDFTEAFLPVPDDAVREAMGAFHTSMSGMYELLPACWGCPSPCHPWQEAMEVFDSPDQRWEKSLLRAVLSWTLTEDPIEALPDISAKDPRDRHCLAAFASDKFVRDRRAFYGLSLEETLSLQRALSRLILWEGNKRDCPQWREFLELWRGILRRKQGVLSAVCADCRLELCMGHDLADLLDDIELERALSEAETAEAISRVAERVAVKVLGRPLRREVDGQVFHCYMTQKLAALGLSTRERLRETDGR